MNNILWILLAILALALSWFAESIILAWITCFFILLLVASRILVRLMPQADAQRVISTEYAHQGEKIRVRVQVQLQRRPWGWFLIHEQTPPLSLNGSRGVLIRPAGQRKIEFTYTIEARRRGYFQIGPLIARYSDPFGFAESRRQLLSAEYVTIFPRIAPMGRPRIPLALAPGELLSVRRTFEDTTSPAGIRDYRRGDALRRIHWKATARSGQPQSKLYDVSTSLQAMIVLNLYRPDYPTSPTEASQVSELAAALTASLAQYFLSAGQRVGVASNGVDVKEREELLKEAGVALLPDSLMRLSDELALRHQLILPPGRTPERPLEIMTFLARLQPARGQSLAILLDEVRRQLSWGEAVVVVTPSVDTAVIDELITCIHAGFAVIPLVVGASHSATKAELMLAAARLNPHRIMWEEDIGGLFA